MNEVVSGAGRSGLPQRLSGYVLHQRPFRDNSQLLELLTAEAGRVGAVLRRSRRRAPPEPFQPLWFEWGGRGELKNLHHWEARGASPRLQGPLLYSGLYINELLYRLLHRDDPHPELFQAYENCLAALRSGRPPDVSLRHFEMALLESLGYGLEIQADAEGMPLRPEFHYQFQPGRGLIPCGAEEGVSGEVVLAFAQGDYSDPARQALKRLCRQALAPHLGGRPLLSRQLFMGADR